MFFGSRQQRARDAADSIERQKKAQQQQLQEASAVSADELRREEARQLNAVVNEKLKQLSTANKQPCVEDENAPPQAPPPSSTQVKSRINRRGSVSVAEAKSINSHIKEREARRADQLRETAQSATPPPTNGHGDATPTGDTATSPPPSTATTPAATERALGDSYSTAKPDVKMVGTARAAAKLAGGVFYTLDENTQMLARHKQLQAQKDELSARLAAAEAKLASFEAYDSSALERVACLVVENESGDSSPARKGVAEWLRSVSSALSAAGAAAAGASPSLARTKSRLSGGDASPFSPARRKSRLSGGASRGLASTGDVSPVCLVRPPSAWAA